ncbi:hypothetical protein V5799_011449 [Amblyomma americanum]|uniref:Uncharacterized protein n=1 Tax=Amblyomma americanum TaxID=6943 RepID=A0AAQ4EH87_AMBAM
MQELTYSAATKAAEPSRRVPGCRLSPRGSRSPRTKAAEATPRPTTTTTPWRRPSAGTTSDQLVHDVVVVNDERISACAYRSLFEHRRSAPAHFAVTDSFVRCAALLPTLHPLSIAHSGQKKKKKLNTAYYA